MKGQGGWKETRCQDCGVLQHMEEMPPRRQPGSLEPSSPRKESTPRPPPHHLGWGQHQNDEPHLTGTFPPVLRANQATDAHVPPK